MGSGAVGGAGRAGRRRGRRAVGAAAAPTRRRCRRARPTSSARTATAARAAEAATGIPAAFMVAQAAHESGWGQREIKNADGSASHNLFGIKAGAGLERPGRRDHDHRSTSTASRRR